MIKKTLFDENLTYDEAVQLIKDGVDVNERNDYDNAPLSFIFLREKLRPSGRRWIACY